jgi:hypothetical protein
VWSGDPFNLRVLPVGGAPSSSAGAEGWMDFPYCLHGRMRLGGGGADEWLAVWLLAQMSAGRAGNAQCAPLVVYATDGDGCFLAVEGADHVPAWLDPDCAAHRVFLADARLCLVPPADAAPGGMDRVPSPSDGARWILRHLCGHSPCAAFAATPRGMQDALQDRIGGGLQDRLTPRSAMRIPRVHGAHLLPGPHPGAPLNALSEALSEVHVAVARLPEAAALLLALLPQLGGAAAAAFLSRDPAEAVASARLRTFGPTRRPIIDPLMLAPPAAGAAAHPPSNGVAPLVAVSLPLPRHQYLALSSQPFHCPRAFPAPLLWPPAVLHTGATLRAERTPRSEHEADGGGGDKGGGAGVAVASAVSASQRRQWREYDVGLKLAVGLEALLLRGLREAGAAGAQRLWHCIAECNTDDVAADSASASNSGAVLGAAASRVRGQPAFRRFVGKLVAHGFFADVRCAADKEAKMARAVQYFLQAEEAKAAQEAARRAAAPPGPASGRRAPFACAPLCPLQPAQGSAPTAAAPHPASFEAGDLTAWMVEVLIAVFALAQKQPQQVQAEAERGGDAAPAVAAAPSGTASGPEQALCEQIRSSLAWPPPHHLCDEDAWVDADGSDMEVLLNAFLAGSPLQPAGASAEPSAAEPSSDILRLQSLMGRMDTFLHKMSGYEGAEDLVDDSVSMATDESDDATDDSASTGIESESEISGRQEQKHESFPDSEAAFRAAAARLPPKAVLNLLMRHVVAVSKQEFAQGRNVTRLESEDRGPTKSSPRGVSLNVLMQAMDAELQDTTLKASFQRATAAEDPIDGSSGKAGGSAESAVLDEELDMRFNALSNLSEALSGAGAGADSGVDNSGPVAGLFAGLGVGLGATLLLSSERNASAPLSQ